MAKAREQAPQVRVTDAVAKKNKASVKAAEHGKYGADFMHGHIFEVLCMGETGSRAPARRRRHGQLEPQIAHVRAVRVMDRFDGGKRVIGYDADYVRYEVEFLSAGVAGDKVRAKVKSEGWSVCHIVWEPEVGRLILEATAQRRDRWNKIMNEADALNSRLGVLKESGDALLADEAAEREALRKNNGASDLLNLFAPLIESSR
jgi:hypothetical protein